MKMSDQELTGVSRCPHCSIADPRLAKVWQVESLPRATVGPNRAWAVFACGTCGHGVLAQGHEAAQNTLLCAVERLYPAPREAHDDLPPTARTYLQQAYETLHAPDAAAVMAASAVDAMLKDLGYREGSLYQRIDKAVTDGTLTSGMAKWAHSVRLEANRPRHADDADPHLTAKDAKQSVDFAEALGSFLFVFTKRVERGIATAERSQAEPPAS